MPIKLPADFPAADALHNEGIETMLYTRAEMQNIRPLKIVICNLMPTKIDTEIQLLRLLSQTSIQVEATFLRTTSYTAKHNADHLDKFYQNFNDIRGQKFDGIVITGAPVEQLDFEDVGYWDELVDILAWANDNVFAELFICWGAQAGLYAEFGIKKYEFEQKLFGIYEYEAKVPHQLTRGFDDKFFIPQSRHTGVNEADLQNAIANKKLIELVSSDTLGANILATPHTHKVYILGHLEYTQHTLDAEYKRDFKVGKNPEIPVNYYPNDDPNQDPIVTWRASATIFFSNWVDFVYQETPYDLAELVPCKF